MSFSLLRKLRTFWLSPWFIAMPVTLLVILLLPDIFRKYTAEIVENSQCQKKDGFEYYADLNGDSTSEHIVLFNNTEGKASVKILGQNGFILDHFYFPGEIIQDSRSLATGVFDSSGRTGIFFMTRSNDSIFLHGLVPGGKEKILFRDKHITTFPRKNGRYDYVILSILLFDLDRDGTKEIVSGVMAGFQVMPRLLFTYNIRSGHLQKTPPMANYQQVIDTADLNRDGFPELLATSYSIDNNEGKLELPCDDNSAWLSVYDRNLSFLFPPVQFPGKYIQLSPWAMKISGIYRIIALYTTRFPGNGPPKLMMFDTSGKPLKERILDDTLKMRNYGLFRSDDLDGRIFLGREGGIIEEVDSGLNLVVKSAIKGVATASPSQIDVDGDGHRELMFTGVNGSFDVITRADFSDPVAIVNPLGTGDRLFSVIREAGKTSKLFTQKGNRCIIGSYERNPLYYLKYPVWFTIYLLVLGFILLIRYLQRRTLRQMVNAEKKIAEMQLLLLRNQLDPHFTFNVINSISASILQSKPEEANRNLLTLSRLMRSGVMHSDNLSRSLAEELEFLHNYLDLMKARTDAGFEYRIEIADTVDLQLHVPRMITQIYAENAIKHGLRPLPSGGILVIRVSCDGKNIRLEIEDNGVGRHKAKANGSHGTGKGMTIMDQSIIIFNKFNQKKIRLDIADLEDGQGLSRGTLVTVVIPVGMKYRFYGE